MQDESILVMNNTEKEISRDLIQKINAGNIPVKNQSEKFLFNYEYYSIKQEQIILGVVLGVQYKLRYRDSSHVFFSAWNCKDVCSVFYDAVAGIYALSGQEHLYAPESPVPSNVDLHTEGYIFLAGDLTASFVSYMDYAKRKDQKICYKSQYVLYIYDESNSGVYNELIQRFKKEGYSKIQMLQMWIRGEILYYVIADGAVLRPERQRVLTAKEEKDLNRKIYKDVNGKFRFIDLYTPS
jgi:hypothetical protein